jgi:L-serine dehydratase
MIGGIIIKTIKDIFKIGNGQSSSHTMAPKRAALEFLRRYPNLSYVKVYLYGSLALTGKGHLTDYIIKETFKDIKCDIIFDSLKEVKHPINMEFYGYDSKAQEYYMEAISIGGGDVIFDGKNKIEEEIYKENSFKEIRDYCVNHNIDLAEYVDSYENVDDYLNRVLKVMLETIDRGLKKEGYLPGPLNIKRKAMDLYPKAKSSDIKRKKAISYAYAVSEENASGGVIVTAPTCGASVVLPAVLKVSLDTKKNKRKDIINGLKVAALIGNLIRTNASISGAVAGCQAEVGSACCLAAAFLAYINKSDIDIIQISAEIALEHHLGLTCDPVKGYVQIPCIERNAVASLRAMIADILASELLAKDAKIPFDHICKTVLDTGKNLAIGYRETSKGGLALDYKD